MNKKQFINILNNYIGTKMYKYQDFKATTFKVCIENNKILLKGYRENDEGNAYFTGHTHTLNDFKNNHVNPTDVQKKYQDWLQLWNRLELEE